MITTYTAVLFPAKPSLYNDSGLRHGFEPKATLPKTQSTPTVSHDTTSLCWFIVTLWECHIYTDAIKTLYWIFLIYFLLSDG